MPIARCPNPRCPSSPRLKYAELRGSDVDLHGWQIMCVLCGVSGPVVTCGPEDERGDRAMRAWNEMVEGMGQ
jgi:hypothetical protein